MGPRADTLATEFDVIIVGSGINGLVCAAMTAKRGFRVCVLERSDVLGGCIRSEELTRPGFIHDTLSGFHPLFLTSPGYAELATGLAEAGLQYRNNRTPTGALLADGSSIVLTTSRTSNERAFNDLHLGDGTAFAMQLRACEASSKLSFGLLGGELWSSSTFRLLALEAWRRGPRGLMQYFGEALQTSRHWLDMNFENHALKALLAPWVLHTGLGPDSPLSGFMNRLIALTLESVGMPVVAGGSAKLVSAFRQLIEQHGGVLKTAAEVIRIQVKNGRAYGVQLRDGTLLTARKAVVCSVTPTQLYLRLLEPQHVPMPIQQWARGFKYGRGDMQIHLALSEPVQWKQIQMRQVVLLHLTDGVEGISRHISESERGLLPARPTIAIGQPTVVDSSRSPPGAAVLWIQLQELPSHVLGDALGVIAPPPDGRWTAALKEVYADRVIAALRPHIHNLDSTILGRSVLSPADLEALNVNLVGGDPYSGACSVDQSFFCRPSPSAIRHETHIRNMYHIGASTHPGPGLGGVSGYLVANAL